MGEYNIRTDPDCNKQGGCSAPKITRKITSKDQIIVHENYTASEAENTLINDIALIRLNEPVMLNSESPATSSVMPICLPWNKDDFARYILFVYLFLDIHWSQKILPPLLNKYC